jgi:hypothetical protein
MLRPGIATLLLGCLLITSTAKAESEESKQCRMVACMAGKVGGKYGNVDGSDCAGPIADFFSIKEKKHGDFLPSHSAKKRKKELDKCKDELSQNTGAVGDIIGKFGRLEHL